MTELSNRQFYLMVRTMDMYGGSFAQCIARAFAAADLRNREKLFIAFPELVDRYGPGSAFYDVVQKETK